MHRLKETEVIYKAMHHEQKEGRRPILQETMSSSWLYGALKYFDLRVEIQTYNIPRDEQNFYSRDAKKKEETLRFAQFWFSDYPETDFKSNLHYNSITSVWSLLKD